MNFYSDIPGFKKYMGSSTASLKIVMLRNGWTWRCYSCGLTEWMDVKAPLQVDHINGDRSNCMANNLRLLCPNCHALTDTYAGKNKKKDLDERFTEDAIMTAYASVISKGKTPTIGAISSECGVRARGSHERDRIRNVLLDNGKEVFSHQKERPSTEKIKWPSDADLEKLLSSRPRTEVAKMLGVSDVAVKRRCSRRGIPEPTSWRWSEEVKRKRSLPENIERDRQDKELVLSKSHGTVKGYRLELSLKIPTCSECRSANSEYEKSRTGYRK